VDYAHYWNKDYELSLEDWANFTNELSSEIADANGVLCEEYDKPNSPPTISEQEVRFNGKGVAGHETFHFTRVERPLGRPICPSQPRGYFNFCKTAHKPYDKYVVKALLLAEKHFGNSIDISSDGDWATIRKGEGNGS
jgi:hypothetical protein